MLIATAYPEAHNKTPMIRLTRLNRVPLVLNSDLIEHVEATPDTVIALTTGQKIVVLESPEEIIQRIVDFRRLLAAGPYREAAQSDSAGPPEVSRPGSHP
jgi:flagellar protein FlbD